MSARFPRWLSRSRLLTAVTVAAAIIVVALLATVFRRGDTLDVPLIRVERSNFLRNVRAEGHLEAVRATPILVPSEVRRPYQIAWLAPEGQVVDAGETVLKFDPTELEKSVEDARAGRQTTDLQIVKRSTEAAAQAVNLERDAELAGEELDSVRTFQKRDETIYSRFEIVEAEVDAELAEQRRWHAEKSRETNSTLARTELDLLTIAKRKNEREIERNEKALGLLDVPAPHRGILVVERDWHGTPMRAGNTVFSGQKVAEIPDLSEMKAEVFILEADAGGLEVGQSAEVTIESRPDVEYPARVSRVDTLAKPRLPGSPVQYFGATLELETTDPEVMKPGQRVSAEIRINDLEGVLVVPRQAVVERDEGHFVFKKRGGRFEEAPIVAGVSGLGRMVVDEGLEEGDWIAARDPGLGIDRLVPTDDKSTREVTSAPAAGGGSR